MQERLPKQFLICLAIFIVFTVVAIFSSRVHIGFFGYLAMPIVGTFCTTVGVAIGDAFRRFVKPDVLLASGAYDMFRKKLFWLVGPQAIGWLIGYLTYESVMRKMLGFYY